MKKITNLSKDLASQLLNKEDINRSQLENHFSENDSKEIIESLTNSRLVKEREYKIDRINRDKHADWKKIRPIRNAERRKRLKVVFGAAAVLVISLTAGYSFFQSQHASKDSSVIETAFLPLDDIVLDTGDGVKHVVSHSSEANFYQEASLVYREDNLFLDYTKVKVKFPEKLVYNELTVPYGRRFQVQLSDGSKIHLNSGSSLRYPIQFIKGEDRTVYLEGEAFFEVEKSKQPFIVKAEDMQVKVLGTKFNVSAYPEDYNIRTVLIEGSVEVLAPDENSQNESLILVPGEKAYYEKAHKILKSRAVKTSLYTSWVDGKIVFDHMAFENIAKKLERHYNVNILNNNPELAKEKFTASFDIESIEQVLTSFSKSYNFNFKIKDNDIIIN